MVAQVDSEVLSRIAGVVPQVLAFLAILVIGWVLARVIAKVVGRVLERVGFDRAVQRGGVGRLLRRSAYDPSEVLGKVTFCALLLLVLQLAFGVFGPNPVSDLIASAIAFLPNVFVAVVIIVVAAALAAVVAEIVEVAVGGLASGRALARVASATVIIVGVFMALSQLRIAPDIVNALFYALLVAVTGAFVVAVGGGGIVPLRRQWERALSRMEEEAPRLREEARGASDTLRHRAEERGDRTIRSEQRVTGTRPLPRRAARAPERQPTAPPVARSRRLDTLDAEERAAEPPPPAFDPDLTQPLRRPRPRPDSGDPGQRRR